jgi:hypothetical protein
VPSQGHACNCLNSGPTGGTGGIKAWERESLLAS